MSINTGHIILGGKEMSINTGRIILGGNVYKHGTHNPWRKRKSINTGHIILGGKEMSINAGHIILGGKEMSINTGHINLGGKQMSINTTQSYNLHTARAVVQQIQLCQFTPQSLSFTGNWQQSSCICSDDMFHQLFGYTC